MDLGYLKFFVFFSIVLDFSAICAAQNDITLSIFTVTSRSITARWSRLSTATSYKITATPKNSPEPSVFALFSGNTVMGSVNSLSPNTMYTVTVDAMDNVVDVLSSAEIVETTAPEVPEMKKAYSKQSDSITVEFSLVFGANYYILRVESEATDFFFETEVTDSPAIVLHLKSYTDYTLSVQSVNSAGRSQPSLPLAARTAVDAPELNTTSPSNSTILLTWHQVDHAVSYTLCLFKEGSDTQVVLNTTDTFVTFTGLEAGTMYCIKANAWGPDSVPSGDITVCQITRPPMPGSVYVMIASGRTVGMAVYWDSVHGADSYNVSSSKGQSCSSSTVTYCIISPLSCGQTYSITVTAQNQAGPSDPSVPEDFLTFPCPPESLWVEEPVQENCTLLWSEVLLVDHYVAFVKTDDGTEVLCNTTSTACSFHCACGFTFFMTVSALNSAGSSPFGPVLNYTTGPCCPDDVTLSLVSTETLEIMWSSSRGAELYVTTATAQYDLVRCNDTAPVCVLSNLECNTRYSVTVMPCSDIRGCTQSCKSRTAETAPCSPEILSITQNNSTCVNISWSSSNKEANYTVNLLGKTGFYSCQSGGTSCEVTNLPCGSTYDVIAIASTYVGQSLPSYSVPLETGPCCPQNLTVAQVTQAITKVDWSAATGAQSYIASLASPLGSAKCHTKDSHCLMGCITCGTNYTVSLEALSSTGHTSECVYLGFSSSGCCPSNVRLYGMSNYTLRVYWQPSRGSLSGYTASLRTTTSSYSCSSPPGRSSCDVSQVVCGDLYTVVVAPLSQDGTKVDFCPRRTYLISCVGDNVGAVMYRGKTSVG